jgi:GNAT superfamily N-acetyltransferase
LSVSERGDDRRRRIVAQSLGRHNGTMGHPDDWRPISVFAHGPSRLAWMRGPLIGGMNGGMAWGWLYVSHLWIDGQMRGKGLGAELLARGEHLAYQYGMRGAHLTTASFQARGFYEKQGYSVFGELEDMPPGETLFYMKKRF